MNSNVVCLMGPTCAGKTDVAIELTRHFPCEIVSVDSVMVYRGMDIGAAKPSREIRAVTPHKLIDICDPTEPYSAAQFSQDAKKEIDDILLREKIPLLVGGTMLYFKALQQGLAPLPHADENVRAALLAEANALGWNFLHQRLSKIDPVASARIHPNDKQRLQRALEVYELTGETLTQRHKRQKGEGRVGESKRYQFINLCLAPLQRHVLHERIAKRFSLMLEEGLLEEVQALRDRGDLSLEMPAMRAVGYRQAWEYLLGDLNLTDLERKVVIATRQLAKRQLTWLRAWPELSWLDSLEPYLLEQLKKILSPIFS